jgi:hypothetical protein
MKKQSRGTFFLWLMVAAAIATGTFLTAEHLGGGIGLAPAPSGPADADSGDASGTIAMQNFSGDGYAFSVPAGWMIEKTGSDTIALHPPASSPDAACKIEVSAFPYAAGVGGVADWISHRIGADPSVAITEQSSEDVSLTGGTGVKWIGTIDGIPTTLVYAFSDDHAYEIAPSVIGVPAAGNAQCGGMLQSLLSTLTI